MMRIPEIKFKHAVFFSDNLLCLKERWSFSEKCVVVALGFFFFSVSINTLITAQNENLLWTSLCKSNITSSDDAWKFIWKTKTISVTDSNTCSAVTFSLLLLPHSCRTVAVKPWQRAPAIIIFSSVPCCNDYKHNGMCGCVPVSVCVLTIC